MKPGIRRFTHSVVLGVLCVQAFACDSTRPPAPSPITGSIQGITRDAAGQPLAGVTIEAVAGAGARPAATSQANGAFTIEIADVRGDVLLRATKEGYAPAMTVVARGSVVPGGDVTVSIVLNAQAVPDVLGPGEYRMTIVSDCPDFPVDLRARSYAVTMTPRDNLLSVELKSPFLVLGAFGLDVSGNWVYASDDMSIYEQIPDHTYWRFTAVAETGAEAVLDGPLNSVVLVPFSGDVEYCVLKSAASAGKFCAASPEEILAHQGCSSGRHKLIFDRR